MSNRINFGIDLGTTNSLIAKFDKGTIEIFKNPNGFKEALPSVVCFRKDRILVGDQAKMYAEKDPRNTVSRFKRKMGTTESFKIKILDQSKTPIELSAFVLKELKTFIHTGEMPEAAIITIPASFDMIQSNATKEAGYMAGFKQVVLLQEPIAASLAYANKEKNIDLRNGQWIVYDLGGGTFDVALVRIVEGELKVVDHEGDNYLGGTDFDALIVEKIVVPELEKRGNFTNLISEMKSESGKHNRLWEHMLGQAEQAKCELSVRTSAELEYAVEDDDGKTIDDMIAITRSEFESIIKGAVDSTADTVRKILTRNSIRPQDMQFVLMVGGSTYIPFVRKRIEEMLGIPVNTGVAPTNAIVVGAAYFAGTKELDLGEKKAAGKSDRAIALRVKFGYTPASQESEELFSAKVVGDVTDMFYRITREDGGYDSGLKKLSSRISEDLPLEGGTYNVFAFRIYDKNNNPVATDNDTIQIAQGKYSVSGQMLPEDLSLVKDIFNTGDTKLANLFKKNSVLPAKEKLLVEASRTIVHGSDDEIRIIIVEGPSENHSTVNKTVGYLVISGKSLKKDIIRGTEIDLTFDLSESRDLTVDAYVNPSGPSFSRIFNPQERHVRVEILSDEVQLLENRLKEEESEARDNENYEVAEEIKKLHAPIQALNAEALLLAIDDVTDDRFKLEDRKRKIAQELNRLTAGKRLERLRNEYHSHKANVASIVNESGNDHERRLYDEIVAQEHTFLTTSNPQKLEGIIDRLQVLSFQILTRTPAYLREWFQYLVSRREAFNDQLQAKNLIEAGKRHIEAEDFEKLAGVNIRLHDLLPQDEKDAKEMRHFTGIS